MKVIIIEPKGKGGVVSTEDEMNDVLEMIKTMLLEEDEIEITVEKKEMSKEEFDNLTEFEGF